MDSKLRAGATALTSCPPSPRLCRPGGGRATKKVAHGSRSSRASACVTNEFIGSGVESRRQRRGEGGRRKPAIHATREFAGFAPPAFAPALSSILDFVPFAALPPPRS